jgi:molecular chaperone DnaK (HSP70)
MSHPIGIDLGTTYSAIAKWVSKVQFTGSEAYHIPLENGYALPSKVYIEPDDDDENVHNFVFGKTAISKGYLYPDQYITAVKREMDDATHRYSILGHEYSPIDISAQILNQLLFIAEGVEAPGTYVPCGIVVSVPYYFKQHQNINTKEAALIAIRQLYEGRKFNGDIEDLFLELIAEPIAAGLDYAFNRDAKDSTENILVFDLGGGTFDLTVFTLTQKNKSVQFKVLAVSGDDRLGGEDFDNSLFQWVCDYENIDLLSLDEKSKRRSFKEIQPKITDVKHVLTQLKKTDLSIANAIGSRHIEIDMIKRTDFEDCINGKNGSKVDYIGTIEYLLEKVLDSASISSSDINCVLAVGGSSQIPMIKKILSDTFGPSKIKDARDINLAVSRGAAIYAAYLLDERLEKNNQPRQYLNKWDNIEIGMVTPHQLGIKKKGTFYKILEDNHITPHKAKRFFSPTMLSDDAQFAILDKIEVLQGSKNDYSIVGEIELENIYTHGRNLDDIDIEITFEAKNSSMIHVSVLINKGNKDQSDFHRETELKLCE